MLKKTIFVCTLLVATLLCAQPSEASNKRKKKDRTEQEKTDTVRKPRLTPYEKLFRGKRSVTAGDGFMTLHIVGKKLYFEMPLAVMGKEMLLSTTVTETTDNMVATNGYKPQAPLHIGFSLGDSVVYMHRINSRMSSSTSPSLRSKANSWNCMM